LDNIHDRKNLREIAANLLKEYETEELDIPFDDYANGILYVFFIFSLNKTLNKSATIQISAFTDFEKRFNREILILNNQFKKIPLSYRILKDGITPTIEETYLIWISEFFKHISDCNGMASWLYQYLKKDKEKSAFNKSLKEHKKIMGEDLLSTTQFFTEDYMVNSIVEKTLNHLKYQPIELAKLRVIDPACGSGNFLTHSLDYLFRLYSLNSSLTNQEIVSLLLSKTLVGYELDGDLANIGKINLFIKACNYINPDKIPTILVFSGRKNDQFGFLNYQKGHPQEIDVFDNETGTKLSFSGIVENAAHRIFVTNPPFMGARDMGVELRTYLQTHYPLSKGDLCVSFMERCLSMLKEGDKLGLVNQTSWMYLKTFKEFRKNVLANYQIEWCADLGNDSFVDISGAKTNVALTTISKTKSTRKTTFYYLRPFPLTAKASILEKDDAPPTNVFSVNQKVFLKNKNYEIQYMLTGSFRTELDKLLIYREFANPMQGTSTGNNFEFVDYSWNRADDPDWKLVSKGGGYCKWKGLNMFKVKWGTDAQYIKSNPGSAVRNLDRISSADLVYSDTGTLGMNVRVRIENQVFIAAGPGIQILEGDPFAHLAYLNSRMASFFMKMLSPKLTISAGYIANLPVAENIIQSPTLSALAKRCVYFKDVMLNNKLGNEEFSHVDYQSIHDVNSYVERLILNDLENEIQRLRAEAEIEHEIERFFNFDKRKVSLIGETVGTCCYEIRPRNIDIPSEELDRRLANSLDLNCQYCGTKKHRVKLGCEGFLEETSFDYNTSPQEIYEIISRSIGGMYFTKKKYLEDYLHKLTLHVLGFENNQHRVRIMARSNDVILKIRSTSEDLDESMKQIGLTTITIDEWVNKRLEPHHNVSFHSSPVLLFVENRNGSLNKIGVK